MPRHCCCSTPRQADTAAKCAARRGLVQPHAVPAQQAVHGRARHGGGLQRGAGLAARDALRRPHRRHQAAARRRPGLHPRVPAEVRSAPLPEKGQVQGHLVEAHPYPNHMVGCDALPCLRADGEAACAHLQKQTATPRPTACVGALLHLLGTSKQPWCGQQLRPWRRRSAGHALRLTNDCMGACAHQRMKSLLERMQRQTPLP